MIIAIEIENSVVTYGLFYKDKLAAKHSTGLNKNITADEIIRYINSLLCGESIEDSVVSSVVPTVTGKYIEALSELSKVKPLLISAGVKTGLEMKISNSVNLGSDIVCNSAAVKALYSLPAVIVDMKTATTITGIDKNAAVCGTSIMPGVSVMMNSLNSSTETLPAVDLCGIPHLLGNNTKEAVLSGVKYGHYFMIDGMCRSYLSKLGEGNIVFTGVQSKFLNGMFENIIYDEDLTLKGLKIILDKNRRS